MEMNALGVLYPDSSAACVTFAPSAKSRIASINRSCCLHFPNVNPTSSRNNLSTVLLLAPAALQSSVSGRLSPGSANNASVIRSALGSDGVGSCSGTVWMAFSWSRITLIRCACHLTPFFNPRNPHAWRINSFSSGGTFTTQQARGKLLASRGLRYKVRIATIPDIVMLCATPAGIQTARCVGTTQAPEPVRTVITPREA